MIPLKFFSVFILLLAVLAQAEEPSFTDCSSQVQQFCPTEKIPGKIVACLKKNEAQLSQQCKEEILRAIRAMDQAGEQSGRSLSIMGGLSSQSPPFPVISYEGILTNGKPNIRENRLNISSPVYQTASDYVALSLAASHTNVGESLTLDAGLQTPTDFDRAEIGSQYTHQLGQHKSWGLRGSIGYATDHFSGKFSDTVFNINLQYSFPGESGGYWTWFLFISNNSPLGNYVPLPGFIYIYKSENITALLGFPVNSIQWTPSQDWAYSLSATGPALTAEVAYGQLKSVRYFTAANWNNQSFLLQDRSTEKERLTLEDKKVSVGARSFILGRMQVEGRVGYAFDRLIYVGEGFRNMKRGSQKMDSDSFLSVSLKSAF
jgi:hypothetical protein